MSKSVVIAVSAPFLLHSCSGGTIPLSFFFAGFAALTLLVLYGVYRKHTDHYLNDSIKFRTLFETSKDAIVILDIKKGFIDCNPSAVAMFSAPSKRVICDSEPTALSPEFQPDGSLSATKIKAILEEAKTRDHLTFEWRHKRFDNTEFPAVVQITPIKTKKRILFQGTIQDITDLKVSEKALKESEERLKLAIEVANAGIWDWDLKTGKVLFDDRYYKMAGYSPGDFPSHVDEWRKRVHPSDIIAAEKATESYLKGRLPSYQAEFRYRKKDNSWMWIMARGKIIERDESGKPLRFIGTHSDISEIKKTEAALQRIQKMDAVGQLAGGIAHDFNNILGIMIGNIDLIRLQPDSREKVLRWANAAQKAGIRASQLTSKLLGFSRRQQKDATVLNINTLISEMQNLVQKSVTPQIDVGYTFGDELWEVEVDRGDFEDALVNLVLNAKDAMPDGGRLTIETANTRIDEMMLQSLPGAVPGDYTLITVCDNGKGIAPEDMEHIFEPFFSTKPPDKGTGLGLSMVFGFVSRTGGYINVHSEISKGTTIRLYLPKTEKKSGAPLSPETDGPLPRGTETILIVDDESELCRLGRTMLESLGYTVLTAENGHEAIRLLSDPENSIDLIFTDVVMPGKLSGYDLIDKAVTIQPGIKCLLTSGYSAKAASKTGNFPADYMLLNKPYTLPLLVEKIRQTLDSDHSHESGSSQRRTTEAAIIKRTEWSERYSIGIEAIDTDHLELIHLLNESIEAHETGQPEKMAGIFSRLIDYTGAHFEREEMVMAICQYPHLKNHVQVHSLLLSEVETKREKLEAGNLSSIELIEFLQNWLTGHILTMDKAIKPFAESRQAEIENYFTNESDDARED